jgi:hypothetical protein
MTLLLAACGAGDPEPAPKVGKALGAQRQMLSEGYSLLYGDASKIDLVELVLYVKTDSKAFDAIITAISEYGEQMKGELERIARDYPGVRIDLKPLPEMEVRKRSAIGKDRMIEFAPLSGRSRQEYERTMLISMSNALNHESHLCRAMAEEEPDPGLKKFLLHSEQRYGELYTQTLSLLNREYFRFNANPRKAS